MRYSYVVQPNDAFVQSELYRAKLLDDDTCAFDWLNCPHAPGDHIYVAVACTLSKIDILWEDGEFESGVDPECLVARCAGHHGEHDYFPAMYVTMQTTHAQDPMSNNKKG